MDLFVNCRRDHVGTAIIRHLEVVEACATGFKPLANVLTYPILQGNVSPRVSVVPRLEVFTSYTVVTIRAVDWSDFG